MLLHGSNEAKMPSFITIAICGGYIHKMTGLYERICGKCKRVLNLLEAIYLRYERL